jgi:hypothetical protein
VLVRFVLDLPGRVCEYRTELIVQDDESGRLPVDCAGQFARRPFWFYLLNTLIVVLSTVKPWEYSHQEKSKAQATQRDGISAGPSRSISVLVLGTRFRWGKDHDMRCIDLNAHFLKLELDLK